MQNSAMAEGSNLYRPPLSTREPAAAAIGGRREEETFQEEEEVGELYHPHPNPFVFDFELSSHPNNFINPSFLDDYATSFDFGFDLTTQHDCPGCEYEEPRILSVADEDDEEQMNFVTDLFGPRQTSLVEAPIWESDAPGEVSALEFGFGPGLGSNTGLRVVDIDSESDSEVNPGFMVNDDDDAYNVIGTENDRDEFDWEEVSDRVHFDGRDNLNSLINRIEEISVSSNLSSSDDDDELVDEERNIEWEVLLAVNSLERTLEVDTSNSNSNGNGNGNGSYIVPHPVINLPEDYILTMEYDALFGQLMENENAVKGTPPAAKSAVESLPSMVLTKEEVEDNEICAVCKDDFVVGEKATRMPCCHMYHGDCILPWLSIRNTCPVCRHELPTDDADYEKRRVGGAITALLTEEFEVDAGYNFELLP